MKENVRFTEERIGIVERNKDEIEKKSNTTVTIKGLNVTLEGKAVDVLKAKNILDALFQGFTLEKSFKLLNEKNQLKVVRLKDFASSGMSVEKLKGRIIGEGGRAKRLIEELAKVSVSVHNDNVSMIGNAREVSAATKAVQMLVNGKPHNKVYRYLEQNQPDKEEMI